jgi:hypothetical protein
MHFLMNTEAVYMLILFPGVAEWCCLGKSLSLFSVILCFGWAERSSDLPANNQMDLPNARLHNKISIHISRYRHTHAHTLNTLPVPQNEESNN